MEKAHSRINWENYPSIATPLNEANLNKMDIALDEVDNRVLGLDTAKLDKSTANTMIKDISFAENTGIFTITLLNGTKKTIDTKLEKIATNFSYDYQTQKLNLTLVDGTKQELDLTSLISQFEFIDSDTIDITVDSSGKVSAIVKDGSITENKLQPNFLADVKVEVAKAKSSSDSAYENATIARESAVDAKTYRDEAEQFKYQAEAASGVTIATTEKAGLVKPDGDTIRVDPDGTIHADRGTTSYTDLENKPKINDVVLEGEKTLDELGIASKEALEKTDNKVNIIIEQAELRFKENASGEHIHLDDSADSKIVEFGLYGKAKQNTTSGKNLIPYPYAGRTPTENGITFTDNGDGAITVNGTATANASFYLCLPLLLPKGSYTLSDNVATVNTHTQVYLHDSPFTTLATSYGTKTFTLEEETKLTVRINVLSGATVSNLTFYPMIRLAEIEDNTWEPYTGGVPSPNPVYSQEIEVAGSSGSVEVKSVGKNLIPYPYYQSDSTEAEVSYKVNSDGSVTANGTALNNSYFRFRSREDNPSSALWLEPGDYILSGTPSNITASNPFIWLGTVNDDGTATFLTGHYGSETSGKLFTLTKRSQIHVQIVVNKDVTVSNLTFKPMIRLASDTDNTWEPYKGKTATFPTPNGLAGIKVDNGGNYTDSNGQQWICDEVVKYADGSGEYVQRIGNVIADGTTNNGIKQYGYNNTNFYRFSVSLDKNGKHFTDNNNPIISDKFVCVPWKDRNSVVINQVFDAFDINQINGRISEDVINADGIIEYFKNNPTVFKYILAEPITTPLTAEQLAEIEKLSTFYPVTNISNDADCGMKVKYIADAKSYIDNRLALIEQAMLNSI